MKYLFKYTSILLLGLIIFSSCSKQKYTASFAPAKHKTWNKVETPKITKSDVVNTNDAVVSNNPEVAAPTVKKEVYKESKLISDVSGKKNIAAPFNKAETKAIKKELRKTIYKQVKQNMFKKNSSKVKKAGDAKLIPIIVSLFIPPLGVYLYQGSITNDFWLDLLLTLTYFGGVLYAILVILDVVSIA